MRDNSCNLKTARPRIPCIASILFLFALLPRDSSAQGASGFSVTSYAKSGWGVLVRHDIEEGRVIRDDTICNDLTAQPKISPAGTKVAFFMRDPDRSDNIGIIAVIDKAGSGLVKFPATSFKGAYGLMPLPGNLFWSSDGTHILFNRGYRDEDGSYIDNVIERLNSTTGVIDTVARFMEQDSMPDIDMDAYGLGSDWHLSKDNSRLFASMRYINIPPASSWPATVYVTDNASATNTSRISGCQSALSPSGDYACWATHIDVHSTICIFPWWETDAEKYTYRFTWDSLKTWKPDTVLDPSPYPDFMDIHNWCGNSEDWLCASQKFNQVLYNLKEHIRIQVTRFSSEDKVYAGPGDFFVSAPDTKPVLQLEPDTLTFTVDSGAATVPSQKVTITNSGNGTLSAISFSVHYADSSGWLSTEIGGSGNNQSISNTVHPSSLPGGLYVARVVVSAANALLSKTYFVRMIINTTPRFSKITISPNPGYVEVRKKITFSASALDQFNNAMIPQPVKWQWSTSEGTIDSNGIYTAGTKSGSFSITAKATIGSITLSQSAEVNVSEPLITVLTPGGGERYKIGDTMHIRWTADSLQIQNVDIFISFDAGKEWNPVNVLSSIRRTDPEWGNYAWIIPDSLRRVDDNVSVVSDRCLVRVNKYAHTDIAGYSDSTFSISKRGEAAVHSMVSPFQSKPLVTVTRQEVRVDLSHTGVVEVNIFDGKGKQYSLKPNHSAAAYSLPANVLSNGVYYLQVRENGRQIISRFIICR